MYICTREINTLSNNGGTAKDIESRGLFDIYCVLLTSGPVVIHGQLLGLSLLDEKKGILAAALYKTSFLEQIWGVNIWKTGY